MRRRYRTSGPAHLNDISNIHLQRLRPRACTSRADVTQHCFKRTGNCRHMQRRPQAARPPIATPNGGSARGYQQGIRDIGRLAASVMAPTYGQPNLHSYASLSSEGRSASAASSADSVSLAESK